jgi:hypothetical protein
LVNWKGLLKRHTRLVAIGVGIIIVLVGALLFVLFNPAGNDTVSQAGIRDYAKEYFNEYKYLYDDPSSPLRGLNITHFGNFTFFAYPNFGIDAVISTTHGAALFFDSSKNPGETSVKMATDPIEYYLWSQMPRNTSGFPTVLIEPGEYPLDGVVTVDHGLLYVGPGANVRCVYKDRPFNVTGWGAVQIFGTYIVEHSLVLKGSNGVEDWSKTQADIDALKEFMWDCKSAGMSGTELQTIETRYKPSMLINRIASRMKSGVYKNDVALFSSDYGELEKAANGTMNDTLSKILSDYYTAQQETPPSLLEQVRSLIAQKIDALIMGALIALIAVFIDNRLKTTKRQGT